jgi:tryptophan 2,3-dioxygenase
VVWFKDGPSPGEEKLTYDDYLKVPELLRLQVPLAGPPEHDELQFIIVHQTYELWFRLILHTLDEAALRMEADDPAEAARLLLRAVEIMKVLVAQLRVIETMLPQDFLRFRDRLKPASGFQSAQFREIESVCGQKDKGLLRFFAEGSPARARIERRHGEPSLYERFSALLGRKGFDVSGGREARLAALRTIYGDPARRAELSHLRILAEALVDLDEQLVFWRFHHVRMAERVIGAKVGTGGSEGVAYLEKSLQSRGKAFPELWEVRTML